jgi:hypothetical protein
MASTIQAKRRQFHERIQLAVIDKLTNWEFAAANLESFELIRYG